MSEISFGELNMSKPIIVVAVGGNALLQRGEVMSCENQKKSIAQFIETNGRRKLKE